MIINKYSKHNSEFETKKPKSKCHKSNQSYRVFVFLLIAIVKLHYQLRNSISNVGSDFERVLLQSLEIHTTVGDNTQTVFGRDISDSIYSIYK